MACGILVHWSEMEPAPQLESQPQDHKEVPEWEEFWHERYSRDFHLSAFPQWYVSHFLSNTQVHYSSAPENLTHSTSQQPSSQWKHDSESWILLSQLPLFLPRLCCPVTSSLLFQCLSTQFPLLLNASGRSDLEQKQNSRAVLSNGNTDWT